MARSKFAGAVAIGLAVACCFQKPSFVPGPLGKSLAPAAAAAGAATLLAPAAHAGQIDYAAKKLAEASYPFAQEVDWNNGIFLQAPGQLQPLKALKAIDKMIVMGAQANPDALKEAALAHHFAMSRISGPNGVTSKSDWEKINAAIGKVVASVPESTVMDVYNAVADITDPGVPAYMKSLVNGADAEKAYAAFLEFKDTVKKVQVSAPGPPAGAAPAQYYPIDAAAKSLSEASYPFLKDVDWLSSIYLKPLPGAAVKDSLRAIDRAIVMGANMDGNLLKAAAEAHHKAVGSIDAKGVTSLADYTAVNAALGKAIASAPPEMTMDVYNSFAKIVGPQIPNMMFNMVNPLNANAAAKAFYDFKDTVQATQR